MEKYDLIVLGGGPGGYNAAEKAAAGGLKTLVIEKRALGGVCLNEGCVPSKSLLYSGKVYNYVVNGDHYGVTATGAAIDQKKVIERKNKVVKTLVSGIGAQMKKLGVKVVYAEGKILGRDAEGLADAAESRDLSGGFVLYGYLYSADELLDLTNEVLDIRSAQLLTEVARCPVYYITLHA